MFSNLLLLALFFSSLTTSLPIQQTSQNAATHPISSVASNTSDHALTKRTTVSPTFDPWEFSSTYNRTDGHAAGDILRLTKCYCIDTPSRDLPPVYGQYYGSYYGYDYYNYHQNKSYSFSTTCRSGELETLNLEMAAAESYFLAPKCLSWMEEERQDCWDTGDGNMFCAAVKRGEDYYHWNGQWRRVHNHPPKDGTAAMLPEPLNKECQRLCQTVPANTKGYMQDVVPSDREHKIQLAKQTVCNGHFNTHPMSPLCDMPENPHPTKNIPKVWETWNYMETYTDQADMCEGCA